MFYDVDERLQKKDIDSFFAASGCKPHAFWVTVAKNLHLPEHAEKALVDQHKPA